MSTLHEKLTRWEDMAVAALGALERNAVAGEDLLRHITRQLDREHGTETYALETKWFATYSIRHLQIEDLKFATGSAAKKPADFARYVHSFAQNVKYLRDDEQLFLSLMRRFDEGAAEYGFVIGDHANEADPEFVAARNLATALSTLADLHDEARAALPEVTTRIGHWIDLSNSLSPHKWKPPYEPVETLWHATLYATDICKDGFTKERPHERKGLGAFGLLNTISMTAEPDLALDAANMFHTAWHVAHGHITAQDIVEAMREEGVESTFDFRPHFGHQDIASLSEPVDAMKMLRLYLYASDRQSNPVFVNPDELLEALLTIELDQIGLVGCDVALNDTTEYLHGEAEYRVIPDQVLQVRRAEIEVTGLPFAVDLIENAPQGMTM
jgi:hypothetical protein